MRDIGGLDTLCGVRSRDWLRFAIVSSGLLMLLSGCALMPAAGQWHTVTSEEMDAWGEEPAGDAVVRDCPWEHLESSSPASAVTVSEDPVTATEANALEPEKFWTLVESIPSGPTPEHFAESAGVLAGCGIDAVVAFEARLVLSLYALDGPDNLAWFEKNDPLGLGFASDDVFLYARCATVLGGQAAWERAVAERTLEWGEDAPDVDGMSESLLYMSWDAAGALGYTVDDYIELLVERIPLSFETGSNAELWGG